MRCCTGRRARDAQGRIVATLADYAAVRDLVVDLIGEGIAATVPAAAREAVDAVRALSGETGKTVSIAAIAARLKIDKTSAMRRCLAAKIAGYLVNEQTVRGREALYRTGEPMPSDKPVLPTHDTLARAVSGEPIEGEGGGVMDPPETRCLTVSPRQNGEAPETEGVSDPPPPSPSTNGHARWSVRI